MVLVEARTKWIRTCGCLALALRVAVAGVGGADGGLLERFDRGVAGLLRCFEPVLGLG